MPSTGPDPFLHDLDAALSRRAAAAYADRIAAGAPGSTRWTARAAAASAVGAAVLVLVAVPLAIGLGVLAVALLGVHAEDRRSAWRFLPQPTEPGHLQLRPRRRGELPAVAEPLDDQHAGDPAVVVPPQRAPGDQPELVSLRHQPDVVDLRDQTDDGPLRHQPDVVDLRDPVQPAVSAVHQPTVPVPIGAVPRPRTAVRADGALRSRVSARRSPPPPPVR